MGKMRANLNRMDVPLAEIRYGLANWPTMLLGLFDQMSLALLLLGTLCGFLVPHIHIMLGSTIGAEERPMVQVATRRR